MTTPVPELSNPKYQTDSEVDIQNDWVYRRKRPDDSMTTLIPVPTAQIFFMLDFKKMCTQSSLFLEKINEIRDEENTLSEFLQKIFKRIWLIDDIGFNWKGNFIEFFGMFKQKQILIAKFQGPFSLSELFPFAILSQINPLFVPLLKSLSLVPSCQTPIDQNIGIIQFSKFFPHRNPLGPLFPLTLGDYLSWQHFIDKRTGATGLVREELIMKTPVLDLRFSAKDFAPVAPKRDLMRDLRSPKRGFRNHRNASNFKENRMTGNGKDIQRVDNSRNLESVLNPRWSPGKNLLSLFRRTRKKLHFREKKVKKQIQVLLCERNKNIFLQYNGSVKQRGNLYYYHRNTIFFKDFGSNN